MRVIECVFECAFDSVRASVPVLPVGIVQTMGGTDTTTSNDVALL